MDVRKTIKPFIRWIFPIRRWLHRQTDPTLGGVDFGNLRSTSPVSREWGFDRGLPVDRYYIESFLGENAQCIRGRVLEVADNNYTLRIGGDNVIQSDVLHNDDSNPRATLVADLAGHDVLEENLFDCVICTQTLQLIFDFRSAVATIHRILKPGGTALVTVPGISQISGEDMELTGDYWRFTNASVRRLFAEFFPADKTEVTAYGNVLAATSFLQGLAAEELTEQELLHYDPKYQMLVSIRATKPVD